MKHGGTPPKVAINEAVELAREFSTEKSHLFVNGVLDKMYREISAKAETEREGDKKTE
jgi:N utilization substance protein B